METDLASQRCEACHGEMPQLSRREVKQLLGQLSGWQLDNRERLVKAYRFPDFVQAAAFVRTVTPVVEAEGHHPTLRLRWGEVRVTYWTHAIDALTVNDFIMAAKFDALYAAGWAKADKAPKPRHGLLPPHEEPATPLASLPSVERTHADSVSGDRLMDHATTIAQWVRLSGSEEEAAAFTYLEETCRGFGMTTRRYEVDSLVSWPGNATLRVLGPEPRSFSCITHAFGASTPPDGITGEVVYTNDPTTDAVGGRVVLSDGLANPGKTMAAERAHALAQININDYYVHEMIVTPIWGTPTPDTAPLLPKLVTVSVNGRDGAELKRLADVGELRVAVETTVDTSWRKIPLLTADFAGATDEFVLFSGHVDSWHYGAMDNGSANATMLETARVLGDQREALRRGLRLAFWSGHSHARYSTSTWYADHFWGELHEHCVAHVNVDSTGAIGADILSEANTMAETVSFAGRAIQEVAGQRLEYKRFGRAGDQSFWGVGLPSLFMSLSGQPAQGGAVEEQMARVLGIGGKSRSGGLGWWWHTTHDTLDKLDRGNLVRDTRIYVLTCWRLCTLEVLPFDYHAAVTEMQEVVRELAGVAGKQFDLAPLMEEAATLSDLTAQFGAVAASARGSRAETVNRCVRRLGHLLTPINYSAAGPYGHDLALPVPPLPLLQPIRELARLKPGSDEAYFLSTKLTRGRNEVWHAFRQASDAVRSALTDLA